MFIVLRMTSYRIPVPFWLAMTKKLIAVAEFISASGLHPVIARSLCDEAISRSQVAVTKVPFYPRAWSWYFLTRTI